MILAPASTTPASTLSARSATTYASSKPSATESPCNPPPERRTDRLLGPGSAALRRVLPPAHSGGHFPVRRSRGPLARDLPETALPVASRHPTPRSSATLFTCVLMWSREVPSGVANPPRIPALAQQIRSNRQCAHPGRRPR